MESATPLRDRSGAEGTLATAPPPARPAAALAALLTPPRHAPMPRLLGDLTGGAALPSKPPADGPKLMAVGTAAALAEISGMMRDYLAAYNRHDAAALAGHWSRGGESVDLASGEITRGRGAVEEVFTTLFHTDAETTIDIDIESIRLLRDDVAVVDAVTQLAFSGAANSEKSRSRLSAVVTREEGRWMLQSVRESSLPLEPSLATPPHPLEALGWLVGSWEDNGDGVTASIRAFWSEGGAFLIRSHSVATDPVGQPPTEATGIPDLLPAVSPGSREITEILGWDPERGQIRSWLFNSQGRFAEGTWERHGDSWTVRLEGQGADRGISSTLVLERNSGGRLSQRATGDRLADVMPPACEFIRTGR